MDQYIKSNYYWIETSTKFIFYTSFGIGTLLFSLFLLTQKEVFIFFGFFYVIGAIIVNLLMCIYLSILVLGTTKYQKNIFKLIGLLLINIPISAFYFSCVFQILKY